MPSGLLAILDDITVILDDVAVMSKLAAKKTAGIVGDDLAVNANVVVGLEPSREIPIVGKIALGSLANKALLIPLALALPGRVIGPVLMFGGAFLCYEALHKVVHKNDTQNVKHEQTAEPREYSPEDLKALEKKKVWGAIGTDTVLSAEVIAVALGAVASAPLLTKAMTLTVVGVLMTVGVYGLVAGIVKIDDVGLRLKRSSNRVIARSGAYLVQAVPYLMRLLSLVGTLAMFIVGGGIVLHGIPVLGHGVEHILQGLTSSGFLSGLLGVLSNLIAGVLVGILSFPVFGGLVKLIGLVRKPGNGEKPPFDPGQSGLAPT